MASRKEVSTVLSFSTKFDPSDLVSKLRSLQKEFEAKGITVYDADEDIKQIEKLQEKFRKMMSEGFTSSQDLTEINKVANQIIKLAEKAQESFEDIGIEQLKEQLKAAKKQADELKKSFETIKKAASGEIAESLVGFGLDKSTASKYAKQLVNAVDDAKERLEIEKKIREEIEKQREELDDLVELENKVDEARKTRVDTNKGGKIKHREKSIADKTAALQESLISDGLSSDQAKLLIEESNNLGKFDVKKLKTNLGRVGIEGEELKQLITAYKNQQEQIKTLLSKKAELIEISEKHSTALKEEKEAEEKLKAAREVHGKLDTREKEFEDYTKTGELDELDKVTKARERHTAAVDKEASAKEALEKRDSEELDKTREFTEETDKASKSLDTFRKENEEVLATQSRLDDAFDSIGNRIKQVLSFTTAWYGFRRAIQQTYQDIKDLDKSFGEIAMVTSYSVSDLWAQYDTYAEMANRLGQSTESVIQASGLYYQQGLQTADVMKLTEDTMKLATLAGLDFKDATSQMTAALRAFHMEMDQGSHVTDVYAEVAAHAAVNVQGIADAMSATSAIANSAGMSFENTTAMLATMVEATQEAPKNLGTALKTVIARFTELKENVAGTADSEFDDLDFNKVDKALKSVGVQLKDTNGQFRDLDDVFLELGAKWNTLDRNSQRYIATIAA